MADKNITALTAASALDGSELVILTQGGNSRKATIKEVASAPQTIKLAGYFPGLPTTDQLMAQIVFASAQSIPVGATGARGYVGTQGTDGTTTFKIQKNGVNVGTMQFAISTSTATFTVSSQVDFAIGDVLQLVAPTTPDSTLADVSFTFLLPAT